MPEHFETQSKDLFNQILEIFPEHRIGKMNIEIEQHADENSFYIIACPDTTNPEELEHKACQVIVRPDKTFTLVLNGTIEANNLVFGRLNKAGFVNKTERI